MGKLKINPADTAFSWYIRTRDGWSCQRCYKQYPPPTKALHCSHFQGRGKENTRYDPDNADALCYGCHRYFTSHPAEHYEWQVERKGQDKVDEIRLKSSMYKSRSERPQEKIYWKLELDKLNKELDE